MFCNRLLLVIYFIYSSVYMSPICLLYLVLYPIISINSHEFFDCLWFSLGIMKNKKNPKLPKQQVYAPRIQLEWADSHKWTQEMVFGCMARWGLRAGMKCWHNSEGKEGVAALEGEEVRLQPGLKDRAVIDRWNWYSAKNGLGGAPWEG